MPEDDQEKTQQATPKRKEDSRKKGQVASSREISSAAIILGAALGLTMMGSWILSGLQEGMIIQWTSLTTVPMNETTFNILMLSSLKQVLVILLPMVILLSVIGIGSSVGQFGLLWSAVPITPDFSRINPLKGIKRYFSIRVLADLAKTLIKFIIVGYVAYLVIRKDLPEVVYLAELDPSQIIVRIGVLIIQLIAWSGLAIALLGIVDFIYQRWEMERKLRMSRTELKEEMKETEGSPLLRSRLRSLQREKASRRMMEDVPKADIIITNPTSLAVALMYRKDTMKAPMVAAKGAGVVAMRIREIGRKHGVPIIENKPLARALFKMVEIGAAVPTKLYRGVAEVLAYVYRLRGKLN